MKLTNQMVFSTMSTSNTSTTITSHVMSQTCCNVLLQPLWSLWSCLAIHGQLISQRMWLWQRHLMSCSIKRISKATSNVALLGVFLNLLSGWYLMVNRLVVQYSLYSGNTSVPTVNQFAVYGQWTRVHVWQTNPSVLDQHALNISRPTGWSMHNFKCRVYS